MRTLFGIAVLCLFVGCGMAPRQVLPYVMQTPADSTDADNTDLYLYDLEMGQSRVLVQTPGYAEYDPDTDPTGKRIAYIAKRLNDEAGDQAYALHIYDLVTDTQSIELQSADRLYSPVWSNNGKQIAYVVQHDGKLQIDVRDLTTDTPAKTICFGSDPSWRVDNRAIFYNSRDTLDAPAGDLMVHELKTGLNQSLALRGNAFRNLQRGTSVVYTSLPYSRRNQAVWIIDANNRQTRLSSPSLTHRDLQPVHINNTKFVAFTRIDIATNQAAIYVVERYATDPVETLLFESKNNAYTQSSELLSQ